MDVSAELFGFYCIHLKTASERKKLATQQFSRLDLPVQFIDAVDGHAKTVDDFPSYDAKIAQQRVGGLMLTELGCLESHRIALETFLQSYHQYGVILEDDCVLSDDFLPALETIVSQSSGWDIVRLETRRESPLDLEIINLNETHKLVSSWRIILGAAGILYTRKAALEMLKCLEHYYLPFDSYFGEINQHNLNIIAVYPPIVKERDVASTIDNDAMRSERAKKRRARGRLRIIDRYLNKQRYKKTKRAWQMKCVNQVRRLSWDHLIANQAARLDDFASDHINDTAQEKERAAKKIANG